MKIQSTHWTKSAMQGGIDYLKGKRLTFTIVSLYNASGDRFSKVEWITIYSSYTMHQNLQCKVG